MKSTKTTNVKYKDFFKKGDIAIVLIVVVLVVLTLVFALRSEADEA